jgi:deoxyuridine 5'-triphosphate nucleotidohydrolase
MRPIEFVSLHEDAFAPYRAYREDAGYDLAILRSVILTREPVALPTGLRVYLPKLTWAEIRPRSSAAIKLGAIVIPGTIDQGYTGELKIIAYAPVGEVFLAAGTRLAQLVLHDLPDVQAYFNDKALPDGSASRGEKGFGSSG